MLFKKKSLVPFFCLATVTFLPLTQGAIITVTTTNNVSLAGGEKSLAQALAEVKTGDEIRFNIPGAGPHYIATPTTGYPVITNHNVTIDGYSQPGAVPNGNPILSPNNAQLKIVLDSRSGAGTVLDMDGYGTSESAMLGVVGATNFMVKGLGFLGRIVPEPTDAVPALYCVSFAGKAMAGRVSGCWMGVDVNGATVFGANAGVTGFRFREAGSDFLSDNLTVGVTSSSTNAMAEFNVIAGMQIPVIVEGQNLRVSGNFIGVLPSGTNDFNNAWADLPSEGAIQVGRHGGGTVIGTDGDGVNDANERNIFGGVVPRSVKPNGYFRIIEFYGGGPRNDVVIAGNYFGVGIDGQTRFTNGVPILNGQIANTRIGSDFDGKSDAVEGNVIFNNYPTTLFTPDTIVKDFIESVGVDALISLRGNKLVNNFVPPISPLRDKGEFMTNYYGKALATLTNGIIPVLLTNTTVATLIGKIPIADTNVFPVTIVDVYTPDPEGLNNRVAELPNGFIQGLGYLGSFVEGSATDLNTNPGEFEFDISQLNLSEGAKLTVTANVSLDPVGTPNAQTMTTLFSNVVNAGPAPVISKPPVLSVTRNGANVTITWTGNGTLQSAASVIGPWSNETITGNSFNAPITGIGKFFRVLARP